ncbi:MAG: DUF3795 domain-containing protein [bacterium]|nr:DUF3795 domain-containing protein [bacterium]
MKSRIPQTATVLAETMAADGWRSFGEYAFEDFKSFWSTLNKLAEFEKECPDCRGGCGDPGCNIRKCAQERGTELCPLCVEFPCRHIDVLAQRYPNLIGDGRRLKQVGVETWVREQEVRRRTGFCYCDIRFHMPDADLPQGESGK